MKNEFGPEQQSEHSLSYAQSPARAVEVLGDVKIAKSWLREQNPALAGEIPLDLVDTEAGIKQVDTVLGRIEHGIFC